MSQVVFELKDGTILESPKCKVTGLEELVPSITRLRETNDYYMITDENGKYAINANDIVSVKVVF